LFAQGMAPGGLMCGLLALAVALVIGLAIAAVILRAAVSFFNKLAGGADSPEAVPEPGFGKSMGISFVMFLVNLGVSIVFGLVGRAVHAHPLAVQAVSTVVSFLMLGVLLAAMLPTTFGKGVVLSLLNLAVMLAIFIVIFMVVLIPLGLTGALMR
jgi:hypothetical protein